MRQEREPQRGGCIRKNIKVRHGARKPVEMVLSARGQARGKGEKMLKYVKRD